MISLSRMLLGAALVVGLTAPLARAAEPDKLLPAEADTVAVVNVKQILESDIVKKYALDQLKQLLDGQDAKKLLGDLGLDPLKDIEKLVVASMDTKFARGAEPQFLIIVHGKFDPEKLYKTAEIESKKDADKFAMIKDGNTVMFKYQGAEGQPPVYATVVDDKTVVAASEKKLITNALKAADAAKPATLKKELSELIKKADEKASLYVISLVKGKLDEIKIPMGGGIPEKLGAKLGDIEKSLPKLESVAVSIKIAGDVNLDVTIGMKDEDAALDFRNAIEDVFKELKPLAQLAGAVEPRAKPLSDILATVKTVNKAKDVTITGKVTGANIGKMVNPNGD